MAAKSKLVPCPDCASAVSPRAFTCPQCGRDLRWTPWRLVLAGTRLAGRGLLAYAVIAAGSLGVVWLMLARRRPLRALRDFFVHGTAVQASRTRSCSLTCRATALVASTTSGADSPGDPRLLGSEAGRSPLPRSPLTRKRQTRQGFAGSPGIGHAPPGARRTSGRSGPAEGAHERQEHGRLLAP